LPTRVRVDHATRHGAARSVEGHGGISVVTATTIAAHQIERAAFAAAQVWFAGSATSR
jgi:hypothetical protein